MIISRKKSNLVIQYSLNSAEISQADTYRYLGVLINSTLTWSDHIVKLAADSSRTLGFIKRSLRPSPPAVRKLAFETFVRSKLEFASAIWSPHQDYLISSLEAVQKRAARFISSQYSKHASVISNPLLS